MTLQTFLLIASIPAIISVAGLFLLAIGFRSRPRYMKLLGLILLTAILSTAWSLFMPDSLRPYINQAGALFNITEFVIITVVYYDISGRRNRELYLFLSVIVVLLSLGNLFFYQRGEINSYSMTLSSLVNLLYSVIYFYNILKNMPAVQLHRHAPFWFNAGTLVYHGGGLFIFVFTSYLIHVFGDNMLTYWSLHNILAIIQILTIIGAVWLDRQNSRSLSSLQ